MNIIGGIYQIETSYPEMGNVPLYIYLIWDRDVALIDTGVPGFLGKHVKPYMETIGLSLSDVTVVLNTHGHPDHFGGNADAKQASKAKIFAPLLDTAWVEDHARHWQELWEAFPGDLNFGPEVKKSIMEDYCGANTKVDLILRDGDHVDLGPKHKLVVIPTPGHSPGHVTYYDAQHKAAFTGDTVQGRGIPLVGKSGYLGPLYTDVDGYVAGIRRLMSFDIELLLGAHSFASTKREAKRLLAESLAYVDEVDFFVEKRLRESHGPLSLAEIADGIGSSVLDAGGITLQSVGVGYAHLRRMAARGKAESRWGLRPGLTTGDRPHIA